MIDEDADDEVDDNDDDDEVDGLGCHPPRARRLLYKPRQLRPRIRGRIILKSFPLSIVNAQSIDTVNAQSIVTKGELCQVSVAHQCF